MASKRRPLPSLNGRSEFGRTMWTCTWRWPIYINGPGNLIEPGPCWSRQANGLPTRPRRHGSSTNGAGSQGSHSVMSFPVRFRLVWLVYLMLFLLPIQRADLNFRLPIWGSRYSELIAGALALLLVLAVFPPVVRPRPVPPHLAA